MQNFIGDWRSLLYSDIVRRKKKTPLIIMVSFVLTFGIARLTVMCLPHFAFVWREYHIHHFYYGILALAAAGWIALVSNREGLHNFAAFLFGLGLGLVTDEFGLMLTCASPAMECNYLARQSYDLAVILVLVFLNIIYLVPLLSKVKGQSKKVIGRIRSHK